MTTYTDHSFAENPLTIRALIPVAKITCGNTFSFAEDLREVHVERMQTIKGKTYAFIKHPDLCKDAPLSLDGLYRVNLHRRGMSNQPNPPKGMGI